MRLIGSEAVLKGDPKTGLPFMPRNWEEKEAFRGCPGGLRGPWLETGGGEVDLNDGVVGEDRSASIFVCIC
jgi:hypothetical protein